MNETEVGKYADDFPLKRMQHGFEKDVSQIVDGGYRAPGHEARTVIKAIDGIDNDLTELGGSNAFSRLDGPISCVQS